MSSLKFKDLEIHYEVWPAAATGNGAAAPQPELLVYVHGVGANREIWRQWHDILGQARRGLALAQQRPQFDRR